MEHLRTQRDALIAEADGILKAAEGEKRNLTADESIRVEAIHGELDAIKRSLDTAARIREQREQHADDLRSAAKPAEADKPAARSTEVNLRDPGHYRATGRESWFADRVKAVEMGDPQARERLRDDNAYTRQEMEKRAHQRDLSTADTAGQELVPPLYLQDTFVEARVASAIAANLVTNLPLPPTGRSVTVPFQDGSASVGIASENGNASETDATFDDATATIYMAQGIQDMSAQLVERSDPGADMVMMRHLARLLASHIDTKVINGSGSSEPVGVLNATGENAVTWTDYSPTFAEAFPKIADAIQQVESGWMKSPTGIVVHPRRANKWLSELDSSNRPLASPAPLGAQNVLATSPNSGQPVAEGFSGYSILGVPMYKDGNVPTTLGGSTIQDAVLICDWEALLLWLGPVIFEVSKDVGFKTSTFTVKARQYYAFSCNHAPEAIGHITGAGLDTPSF